MNAALRQSQYFFPAVGNPNPNPRHAPPPAPRRRDMETAVLASLEGLDRDPPAATRFATKNLAVGGAHTVNPSLAALFTGTGLVRRMVCLQVQFLAAALRHILDLGGIQKAFRVGVLGCGRIGAAVVHHLLDCAGLPPGDVLVGTRRPDTPSCRELARRGVVVSDCNADATRRVRLLVICCLPSQMRDVSRSVAGTVRRSTIVCSCVAGYPVTRLSRMLQLEEDRMVLRIGVQVPVSVVASALGGEELLRGGDAVELDHTAVCRFAGEALVPRVEDPGRLHTAIVAFTEMLRPTQITDEYGRAVIPAGFSTKALVCQALYGNRMDPGDADAAAGGKKRQEAQDALDQGGVGWEASERRKAALSNWFPAVLLPRDGRR